jgi:hypothetical protein
MSIVKIDEIDVVAFTEAIDKDEGTGSPTAAAQPRPAQLRPPKSIASHEPDSAFDEFAALILLPALDDGRLPEQVLGGLADGEASRPLQYLLHPRETPPDTNQLKGRTTSAFWRGECAEPHGKKKPGPRRGRVSKRSVALDAGNASAGRAATSAV